MNVTSDLASWAAVVGVLLPLLVALLQKDHWSTTVNGVIFGVSCVAASVIYYLVRYGTKDFWVGWEGALLATVTWGLATFHAYWRPSGLIAAARSVPILGGSAPAKSA